MMINAGRLKKIFSDMVKIDSPSLREGAVARAISEKLRSLGIDCTDDGSAAESGSDTGNLIAKIPGDPKLPSVLLAAHMDTVSPCKGKCAVETNGRITSAGDTVLGADDAAGIAIMLEVAHCLTESAKNHPDVTLLFTTGEEIGLVGAKQFKGGSLKAEFGYVLDDAGRAGGAICHAPAHVKITVNIVGKSAHAGVEPEKGIDSIRIFANAVDSMALGRIDCETTANIGIVKGGNAMNTVCGGLEAVGEARSRNITKLKKQVAHMRQCFEDAAKRFGGKVQFQQTALYGAMSLDDRQPVVQRLKKAAADMNIPFTGKASGGGSDASVLNALGIAAIVLSVGYEKMHTTEEYLDLHEFKKAAELTWKLVTE